MMWYISYDMMMEWSDETQVIWYDNDMIWKWYDIWYADGMKLEDTHVWYMIWVSNLWNYEGKMHKNMIWYDMILMIWSDIISCNITWHHMI